MSSEYDYEYVTDDSYDFPLPSSEGPDYLDYDHISMSQPVDHPSSPTIQNASLSQELDVHPPRAVEIATNDPSIAFSTNLTQSKSFIFEHLKLSPNQLRSSNVGGLIVLRLKIGRAHV